MKSKPKQQAAKNNYIAGPTSLEILTNEFRTSLNEWRDEKTNEPRLIEFGGESQPLFCASVTEILDYATEYTKKWKSIPERQKEDSANYIFKICGFLQHNF